jgi:hypothetical protein
MLGGIRTKEAAPCGLLPVQGPVDLFSESE